MVHKVVGWKICWAEATGLGALELSEELSTWEIIPQGTRVTLNNAALTRT